MKKYRRFIISAALLLLCGCGDEQMQESFTETAEDTSFSHTAAVSEMSASETESITFSFAVTETEMLSEKEETTAPSETAEAVTEKLSDNQLEYKDKNLSVLMEFTGAEELKYYPKAVKLSEYSDNEYVLHSRFTVTNLSDKSFDLIPQKMIIYGRHKDSRWDMMPITRSDTGLVAADNYYTVEPEESVEFALDFVGKRQCIEYANEIRYAYIVKRSYENIDYEALNNVTAAENFQISDRLAVQKAVSAALDVQAENSSEPRPLTPIEGEYSVTTPKNSYCFTVESINDGAYIKLSLRLQCLTGEAEVFEPNKFRLTRKGDHSIFPHWWSFDAELVEKLPEREEISGVSDPVYNYPFELYIRPDATAEYVMYFFTSNDDIGDYYMFSYEGSNDEFECIISI